MLKRFLFIGLLLALIPAAAAAAVRSGSRLPTSAGPRVGFSVDPDQLVMGGHLMVGDIAPNLTFDPALELGFGDDLTLVGVTFDLHYHLALQDSDWAPYFGAGIGVTFSEYDRRPPRSDDSDTDVGGSLVLGAGVPTRSGNRFFGEMRFGLGSIPDLKLIAGWNFRL